MSTSELVIVASIPFFISSAITGAAVLYALTPSSKRGNLGVLELREATTYWQGFAIEGVLGFLIAFVFLSGTDPGGEDTSFGPRLSYGAATIGAHLFAVRCLASLSLNLNSGPPRGFGDSGAKLNNDAPDR